NYFKVLEKKIWNNGYYQSGREWMLYKKIYGVRVYANHTDNRRCYIVFGSDCKDREFSDKSIKKGHTIVSICLAALSILTLVPYSIIPSIACILVGNMKRDNIVASNIAIIVGFISLAWTLLIIIINIFSR